MRGPRPSGPARSTSPSGAGGRWIAGARLGLCLALAAGFASPCRGLAFASGAALAFAFAFASVPSFFAFASAFDAAFLAFAGAFVALAPLPSAFAASASSTLDDAVVTSSPAFWSAARASFEGMSSLLRYLVDALLCHSVMKSKVSC